MGAQRAYLVYAELRVRDLRKARRFYSALGLRPISGGTLADGTELLWLRDPTTRQLLQLFRLPPGSRLYRPFRSRAPFDLQLMFSVPHLARLRRRLRGLGGRFLRGFTVGDVVLTFLRDPDGTWIELLSWTAAGRRRHTDPPQLELATIGKPGGGPNGRPRRALIGRADQRRRGSPRRTARRPR